MSVIDTLNSRFPVRKSKAQKEAFRSWVIEQAAAMGYTAQADATGYSRNVVIGDPQTAGVTFTAHYDTPPRMVIPNLCTPTRRWIFLLYQVVMSLGIICVGALPGLLAAVLFRNPTLSVMVVYLGILTMCVLMMLGPANPHCVNDNTSGVAAVLELMARIPEQQRGSAAFILFDNEEKGLLGSASYAGKHPVVKKERLLINMDCVGDGEYILFFANKATRALPAYPQLEAAMKAQKGCSLLMNDMEKCIYPSDQANFKLGMAVCACKQSPRLGYYFDKIHTPKDVVCDQKNLDFIADGLAQFVNSL